MGAKPEKFLKRKDVKVPPCCSIRFSADEYIFLKELSDIENRSISSQVRMIIRQWRIDRGL